MLINLLSTRDLLPQPVPGRWQRTRRVGIVSAGRIAGLVEIEQNTAILRRLCIEEARSRICFLAAGQVPKDDKQSSAFHNLGIEAILLPAQRKRDISGK